MCLQLFVSIIEINILLLYVTFRFNLLNSRPTLHNTFNVLSFSFSPVLLWSIFRLFSQTLDGSFDFDFHLRLHNFLNYVVKPIFLITFIFIFIIIFKCTLSSCVILNRGEFSIRGLNKGQFFLFLSEKLVKKTRLKFMIL